MQFQGKFAELVDRSSTRGQNVFDVNGTNERTNNELHGGSRTRRPNHYNEHNFKRLTKQGAAVTRHIDNNSG